MHRLIIAPINPFVIVSDGMGHEKLAVNCFLAKIIGSLKAKHPRLTASTSFQMVHAARSNRSSGFVNLIFLQGLYKVSIQQNFFATSYGKGVIERLEVTRSVLSPKVSGLVMMHCALEISFLCKAELHQCAYIFPANVDKSWIESSEVVRVITQSTWDNYNHYRFDVVI